MLAEIYLWLESRTGIPFNFEDDITTLETDIVATDPDTWSLTIFNIIGLTKEAVDAVTDFEDEIPDDLPSARKIKSIIAENTRLNLRYIISKAFQTLGLVVPESISAARLTDIRNITVAFNDLVHKLSEDTVADISKTDWFDKYDEDHNDVFTDTMEITKQDLDNIQIAITSIREFEEENNNDDEE